jgi:DNA-binding NarL/FixJ family response regulator
VSGKSKILVRNDLQATSRRKTGRGGVIASGDDNLGLRSVLILDDEPIIRFGLRKAIEENEKKLGKVRISEASTREGRAVLKASADWELVILELGPEMADGLALLKEFGNSGLNFLVFTKYFAGQCALAAFKWGARGYVSKAAQLDEIIAAVVTLLLGREHPPDGLGALLRVREVKLPHDLLTPRELDLLTMLALGKSQKLISTEWGINARTVSQCRTRLLKKMKVDNDVQVAHYAFSHGLVTVDHSGRAKPT